jgi:aminopeptidase N
MQRSTFAVAAVAAAAAFASLTGLLSPRAAGAAGGSAASAPSFRLPGDVRPLKQSVELWLDPAAEDYRGAVRIEAEVAKKTSVVWLHAVGLRVRSAGVTSGGQVQRARVQVAEGSEMLGLLLDAPIAAGPATLALDFEGTLDSIRTAGLYRQEQPAGSSEFYVHSLFQPTDARRAFPCFDEPAFKIPWRLTVHAPLGVQVLSNAPQLATEAEADGRRAFRFAETKPMPSYLVALAAGPLDLVDGAKIGRREIPLRVAVPRGRGSEAKVLVATVTKAVALLEEWFDSALPVEKLDIAITPRDSGTMEHLGLLALGEELALLGPGEDNAASRYWLATTTLHELAHYWLGDVVTAGWWDDLWLHESLATWIEDKLAQRFDPAFHAGELASLWDAMAMEQDALSSARPVRGPVSDAAGIRAAFDAETTYRKGAAVFAMFERRAGAARVQQAIRRFVEKHPWGSANTSDFLVIFASVTDEVTAAALGDYLSRPGLPGIQVELDCGAVGAPRAKLSQRPFHRGDGAAAAGDAAAQPWSVPVCVRWGQGGKGGEACALLTAAELALPLDGAKKCPDWVHPNANALGWYRSLLAPGAAAELLKKGGRSLSALERSRLYSDVAASVDAGALPAGEALGLLSTAGKDASKEAQYAALALAATVPSERLGPDLREPFAALLRKSLGGSAGAVGWKPKSGESPASVLLRWAMLPYLADVGADGRLAEGARDLAMDWMAGDAAVPTDSVYGLLAAAARRADPAFGDALVAEAKKTQDRDRRSAIAGALLGSRSKPLVEKGLALLGDGTVEPRDGAWGLLASVARADSRETAWAWVKERWDWLLGSLSPYERPYVFMLPQGLCESPAVDEAEAFLLPRAKGVPGAAAMLADSLGEARACVAAWERNRAAVEAALLPKKK